MTAIKQNLWRGHAGQGMSEYGLIGALVLAIAIPAIVWLGMAMNDNLQHWSTSMAVSHAKTSPQSLVNNSNMALAGMGKPIMQQATQSVGSLNGGALSQTVATLGANGATDLAADHIVAVANQLKADGKLTDSQYNLLIQLANQGHKLGDIEQLIETTASKATNVDRLEDTRVTFEGRTYTIEDLGDMIGYKPPDNVDSKYSARTGEAYTDLPTDLLHPEYGAQGELKTFLSLYQKVEKSGLFSDPSVKDTITQLSSEIALLNESVDQAKGVAWVNGEISPGDFQTSVVSTVTHADSTQICTTGQGKDANNHCSG